MVGRKLLTSDISLIRPGLNRGQTLLRLSGGLRSRGALYSTPEVTLGWCQVEEGEGQNDGRVGMSIIQLLVL